MISYSTNWMGPINREWVLKNGTNWAGGRIDMRGEDLGPYGDEVSAPTMDVESWKELTDWLGGYKTEEPDYDVINTFQKVTGHVITFWERMTDKPCSKCNGTGFYYYDENHGTVCAACCKHDQGWWELTKGYAGYIAGADNRCCKAGCGTMRRDIKKPIIKLRGQYGTRNTL